jgi:hypothetical protein
MRRQDIADVHAEVYNGMGRHKEAVTFDQVVASLKVSRTQMLLTLA